MNSAPIVRRAPFAAPMPGGSLLALSLLALCLLIAMEATDVDRIVEDWIFDPISGSFPLRHDTFLEVVLHYWSKYLVALIAGIALFRFALSFFVAAVKSERRLSLFVALSIMLSTTAVSGLKLANHKHCPWDLERYGGGLPYARLLDSGSPALRPGRCFPAGHASTGFSLLCFYFVGLARRNARLARAGLGLGLLAGLGLGYGRMLQGAHFLSHVLWSGAVCWLVILGLYAVIVARRSYALAR